MRQLAGADAQFLYSETRTQHYHTIKVMVVDPTKSRAALDFDSFKAQFGRDSAIVPVFHWRMVPAPLGLAHPSWSWQRELDLDYHIRRAAVPSPGGNREFCEVVSEIASTGLERDRPLFQIWWVEGLEGGRLAYVTKLHHAVADGSSSAQLLIDATQEEPDGEVAVPALRGEGPEPLPAYRQRLAAALRYDWELARGLPRFLGRLLRFVAIGTGRAMAGKGRPAGPFQAPMTRFNQKLTPHRWFANVDVSLDDLKRVGRGFGCTINDVFVAISAGAIRRYLELRDELPEESLTATIPVSIRTPEQQRTYGNRLSSWFVAIATDVEDPVERLRVIARNTRAARESWEAKDPELQHDAMEYGWLYRGWQRVTTLLARRFSGRPAYSAILSNVRGPDRPVFSNAAPVVALRSMGPLSEDLGLNITGWSYAGTMSIGVVACREHVPDIWELADRLPEALHELVRAADKQESSDPGATRGTDSR